MVIETGAEIDKIALSYTLKKPTYQLMTKTFSGLLLCFFLTIISLQAQTEFILQEDSEITIDGTSTLHTWTAVVNEYSGFVHLLPAIFKKKLKKGAVVKQGSFNFKVESIDGGRGASMNKKIRTALKSKEHPEISFQLTDPAVITEISDEGFTLVGKGQLVVGGISKEQEVIFNGKFLENGDLQLEGSKDLQFSTFDIEPPSAMFGQIVTGNDITLNFNLRFTKK
ncbi:MAG: hypothetical protein AAFO07_29175 [Bacteroidota bacterium]